MVLVGGVDKIDGDVLGKDEFENRLPIGIDDSEMTVRLSTTWSCIASSKPGGGVEHDGIPPGIIYPV